MKKKLLVYFLMAGFSHLVIVFEAKSQEFTQKLNMAMKQFVNNDQLKHAIFSLYVVDARTGKALYDKNSQVALSPASAQKVITSITAMELLGIAYRFKTTIGYDGAIKGGVLEGKMHMYCSGDPTFGSWRYVNVTPTTIKSAIIRAMRTSGINNYVDNWTIHGNNFETQTIPGGWLWEDIGNYYGAGFGSLNWRENQADINLRTDGIPGDSVQVLSTDPSYLKINFINELKKGKAGTGDNSCFYYPIGEMPAYLRGTIPPKEKKFTISISIQDSHDFFLQELRDSLEMAGIKSRQPTSTHASGFSDSVYTSTPGVQFIYTHYSPTLDSINYWFLKKSVNLYGEALLKTIALEKTGFGSAASGLKIIQDFWQDQGIDRSALNMIDGSGLSPQNSISAHALVTAMQYAKNRPWFNIFYQALPEVNGIKMKSGSIGGVRSYTGYIKSKTGKEYTFAFIINNFSGPSSNIVSKMWKVLDVIK